MAFEYLPGIFQEKQDGNLTILNSNDNPIVLIMGTAGQGDSEVLHEVVKVKDSAHEYGKLGTLTRGMYETSIGGALNIRLFRIGATAASLATDFGVTIDGINTDWSIPFVVNGEGTQEQIAAYKVVAAGHSAARHYANDTLKRGKKLYSDNLFKVAQNVMRVEAAKSSSIGLEKLEKYSFWAKGELLGHLTGFAGHENDGAGGPILLAPPLVRPAS